MTVTRTQKEYQTGVVEVRHINPSIMEGERGHTSLFGSRSAVPIVRFAPTFIVQPSISGSFKIPSVLTCNPGVIEASPQADLFFQWQADGVDIDGETSRTLTTVIEFDAVVITCEVDATNYLGTDTGESTGITTSIIEPIENWEFNGCVISGLNQVDRVNIMSGRVLVATGMWVEDRFDTLSLTGAVTQGISIQDTLMTFDNEVYVMTTATYVQDLTITNPGAESGDFTGWTTVSGSPVVGTDGGSTGDNYFTGDPVNTTEVNISQDIAIPTGLVAAIDDKLGAIVLSYKDSATAPYDTVTVTATALDVNGNSLADPIFTHDGTSTNNNVWTDRTMLAEAIPIGVRFIRLNIILNNGFFNGITTRVDDLKLEFYSF